MSEIGITSRKKDPFFIKLSGYQLTQYFSYPLENKLVIWSSSKNHDMKIKGYENLGILDTIPRQKLSPLYRRFIDIVINDKLLKRDALRLANNP